MATAITPQVLAQYIGLTYADLDESDTLVLDGVTAAVNVLVPGTVPRVRELAEGSDWPADVMQGALMQGARLFSRRRSPGSVSSFSDTTGAATYVARWDPDIERLLHTGKWAPPAFG